MNSGSTGKSTGKSYGKLLRSIFWGLALVVVVALTVFAMRPKPILVDVMEASTGELKVTIDEDGLTRIRERYVVSTPLAGRLQRITLDVGDMVVADRTQLATMMPTDPALLDPRAVAQATARVSAAERRLDVARAGHAKAKTAVEFSESQLKRATELKSGNAVSDTEFEERRQSYRIAKEEHRAAGFGVDIADYELELERAALLLTAPDDKKSPGESGVELPIKAPIHGRVLRVYQESAAVLQAGESIIELGDPADLEIVADVLSVDAVRVSPGDPVTLENWGGDESLRGEVRIVEPSGFTKLSALGVEEQRVNVIIDILDPPQDRTSLGDGFRVDTRIVVWQTPSALKVPTSSLFRVDGQWHLFAVTEGMARQLSVAIGQNNGIEAQVLSGLEPGAQVIVHPSDNVEDGTKVEPRT